MNAVTLLAAFFAVSQPLVPVAADDDAKPVGPSFFKNVTGARVGGATDAFATSLCIDGGDDLEFHFAASGASMVRLKAGGKTIKTWLREDGADGFEGSITIAQAAFGTYTLVAYQSVLAESVTSLPVSVTACATAPAPDLWGE